MFTLCRHFARSRFRHSISRHRGSSSGGGGILDEMDRSGRPDPARLTSGTGAASPLRLWSTEVLHEVRSKHADLNGSQTATAHKNESRSLARCDMIGPSCIRALSNPAYVDFPPWMRSISFMLRWTFS